jgi:hypothetical protein
MFKAPPRYLVNKKSVSQKTSEELAAEFATLTLTPEKLQLLNTLRTKWANRCTSLEGLIIGTVASHSREDAAAAGAASALHFF